MARKTEKGSSVAHAGMTRALGALENKEMSVYRAGHYYKIPKTSP